MPNMSYCRFRNTINDMRDCVDHLDDVLDDDDIEEETARNKFIAICKDVAQDYADDED